MKDFVLAAGMMRCQVGDMEGNMARAEALAARAAGRGAKALLLPETCLTGYTARESMAEWAQPVPGPLTDALIGTATRLELAISAGLVEKNPRGLPYITQVTVSPDGRLNSYRKTHLGPPEIGLFAAGDALSVVEAAGVRFGLQVCYEGHFPEISQTLVLDGAEVLLAPHASPRETPREKLDRWMRYLPTRAYDCSVFLAACNAAGDNGRGLSFPGVAMIVNPRGEVLASAAGLEEGIVTAELKAADLAAVRESRMGYFQAARRPELYRCR